MHVVLQSSKTIQDVQVSECITASVFMSVKILSHVGEGIWNMSQINLLSDYWKIPTSVLNIRSVWSQE